MGGSGRGVSGAVRCEERALMLRGVGKEREEERWGPLRRESLWGIDEGCSVFSLLAW